MALLVSETFINATKGYRFGDAEPYEPWTDDLSRLFNDYRKEYGAPSKVYVDGKDGGAVHVGWCFTKRVPYEDDAKQFYQREVWVSFYTPCAPENEMAVVKRTNSGRIIREPFRPVTVAEARKLEGQEPDAAYLEHVGC